MNNHKIVWKTNISKWIQILLCIVPLFVPSIESFEDIQIFIKDRALDSKIIKSVETTKKLFAETDTVETIFELSAVNQELQQMAATVSVLRDLFADESDWKKEISRTIANKTTRATALSNVQEMEKSVKIIEIYIRLISENHTITFTETRLTLASIIHIEIKKILYFLADRDSTFKQYPLIGAPPLIELALLIALFEHTTEIIAVKANYRQLSCKMHNILLDYRPRTVYARLEKLDLKPWRYRSLVKSSEDNFANFLLSRELSSVVSTQYNKSGYGSISPTCYQGCDHEWMDNYSHYCVKDDFGAHNYMGSVTCSTKYALFVRHRVEQMFPVELLNTLCSNPQTATGFGWLTIDFKRVKALRKQDGSFCELFSTCDPFVRLFIDDKKQFETKYRTNTCCYNLGLTFTSLKIRKSAIVKIEVLDSDNGHFGYPPEELCLRAEANIDYFLGTVRIDLRFEETDNYIEAISFWEDEYK